MRIVRQWRRIRVEQYCLDFAWKDMPGAGFSFPCTKEGVVLRDGMASEALSNLEKCLDGTYAVVPQGVRDYSYTYTEPALGECSCGSMVTLEHFTNTCECGLEYNSSGQLLAPREQWEEPWDEDGRYAMDDLGGAFWR